MPTIQISGSRHGAMNPTGDCICNAAGVLQLVLNIGSSAVTLLSGAHAVNELVRPASVILTHANEAVTEGGKLGPSSRTAALIKQLKPATHLAISGRTMDFDGAGKCVAGC